MSDELLVALAVATGAIAQSVTGLGFALVCSPFLVAALGPREGVRVVLLTSAVLNIVLVSQFHRGIRRPDLLRMLIPAALVTPPMAWLVRHLDADVLAVTAALITIAASVALGMGLEMRRASGKAGAAVAGALSGASNAIAGISGPPVALYAINCGWPLHQLKATLQAYFLSLNVVAIAFLGLPRIEPAPFLGLAAGLAGGAVLGDRIPDGWARAGALTLAAGAGVATIVRALL